MMKLDVDEMEWVDYDIDNPEKSSDYLIMQMMNNPLSKIYLGNAVEVLENHIDDNSIALLFVDPPYNIGKKFSNFIDRWSSTAEYVDWCKKWIVLCFQKLKENGSAYIMTSTEAMPYLDIFIRSLNVDILSRIVWYYDSSGVQAKKYYGSMYELILFVVKNKNDYTFNSDSILVEAHTGAKRKLIDYRGDTPRPYNTQKVPGNVWYYNRVRYRMNEYEQHPSQKPESLLERIILASSNEGDTVLDPFSGTFTTGFVANKLNRKFIGIELQEEYYKIGLRRLNITTSYKSEELKKPDKTCVRKNGNNKKGFYLPQPSLF